MAGLDLATMQFAKPQRLTKMLTSDRRTSFHKPELLCNPAKNEFEILENEFLTLEINFLISEKKTLMIQYIVF